MNLVTFKLSEERRLRLDAQAERIGVPMSDILRVAVNIMLGYLEDPKNTLVQIRENILQQNITMVEDQVLYRRRKREQEQDAAIIRAEYAEIVADRHPEMKPAASAFTVIETAGNV